MKHIETFEKFNVKDGAEINEAAKWGTIEYLRDEAKGNYDWVIKHLNLAVKGLGALPGVLDRVVPGKFDLDNFHVAREGNAFFIYANVKNDNDRLSVDYNAIQNDSEFKKYFDMASSGHLSSSNSLKMSSFFRLKNV